MAWIKHPNGKIQSGKYECENNPINMDLVTFFEKSSIKYYPDNDGKPSIKFYFAKDFYEEWIFKNKEDRDKYYDNLV